MNEDKNNETDRAKVTSKLDLATSNKSSSGSEDKVKNNHSVRSDTNKKSGAATDRHKKVKQRQSQIPKEPTRITSQPKDAQEAPASDVDQSDVSNLIPPSGDGDFAKQKPNFKKQLTPDLHHNDDNTNNSSPIPQLLPPPAPPPPKKTQNGSEKKEMIPITTSDHVNHEKSAGKFIIETQDLLSQKRNLRKVNRSSEYNPVTLTRMDMFEKEYEKYGTSPPEYFPLHLVRTVITSQNLSADLVTLNFNGIDQLTDYLFPLLMGGGTTPNTYFVSLKKLNLVGCIHITDQGLKWIAKLFPEVQMIEINACRKVTEKGLHALFTGCKNLQNLAAMADSVSTIPDSISLTRLFQGSFQWAGNPIISEGKEYSLHKGEALDSFQDPLKKKIIILRHDSVAESVLSYIDQNKDKKLKSFSYTDKLNIPSVDESQQILFNVLEMSAENSLLDSIISEGSIVMIVYSSPTDTAELIQFANQLVDIMSSAVLKCADIVILLVELVNDSSKENGLRNLIKIRLDYLKEALYNATYHLYKRNWHLECLDFKGQQSVSWGIASLEALEELSEDEGKNVKLRTVKVTKSSFLQDIKKALAECAVLIKTLVPWVHCDWSIKLNETISKIPKAGASTQSTIFEQTDEIARAHLHKRYSYPRLGKVLNLLHNWGEGLYISHQHNSLCVTDLKAYENLVHNICDMKPPDMVTIKCLKKGMPSWSLESLGAKINDMNLIVKPSHVVSLMKHQSLLLEVKNQLLENESVNKSVYIRWSDVPNLHESLEYLWPEPCPKSRIFQTNRCYNFLPTLPPRFMPKLLSTILKVYQPLCIWKTGFLLRQGPVDIKASLHRYKGGEFDRTAVLVVSARVVDFHKSATSESGEETSPSSQYIRHVMFACLRQVLLLVDSVFQKVKVYGCITLPCPECAGHSTEGIISIDQTWHLFYYIGVAHKHRHCKQHPHVNPVYLCDAMEDLGEGRVVPLHNYPYHIDAAKVYEDRVRSRRHRHLDPPEKCYYCGSQLDIPCLHCHMCFRCTELFAKFAKIVQPGFITSKSFKVQKFHDGEMQDDERIVSNTKGSVYFYKKGHRMQLLPVMTPFYWDEVFITILKGANFFLHLTFGTGQRLEYHGLAGALVDQHGVTHQNEMWKSRDANLVNIKLESVELGKRVRVSMYLKGLKVLSEEINGWNMKLDIHSEKTGVYVINTPGIKMGWQSDDNKFMTGTTLEVSEDPKTIHQALILEKSPEGYLTLDMNNKQKQYVYTSPQLIPMGTASALQATLSSTLPAGMTQEGLENFKSPVPLWSFLKYQVPCEFESLLRNIDDKQLSYPCIKMEFPSVLYSKQVHLRDSIEKIMFTDGSWNFPMTALLLLPANFSKEDLLVCSQKRLSNGFKLHPLCCFRADVNTVMSVGPTTPQLETLECFHNVHLVDNSGFEPKILKKEEASDTNISTWFDIFLKDHKSSLVILWAWMILLLRLQHDSLTQVNELISHIHSSERLSPVEVTEGVKQIAHFLSQVMYLNLGKDFNFAQSLSDMAVEHLKALTSLHGEMQGLVKMSPPFLEEFLLMCESHQASWQVSKSLNQFSRIPGSYCQFIYSLNLSGNNLTDIPADLFISARNMKDISFTDNKLELLPPEIEHCKQLMTLCVSGNHLKTLPSTLQNCQDLSRLDISKNSFLEFPEVVLKLKNLVRLYAQHLLLKSLPENIGDLCNLEILVLNGNCLTSLPSSLGKLQQLKDLCLNGVCWIKSRSNGLLSKDHFEEFLSNNNLHPWLDRHLQDKTNIFQLFDEDTNGTLDSKEIGKLNAIIFYIFPRFGHQRKEAPDDDTPCGFPEVIFELKNLQYLSFQYQGITQVPEDIRKLTKLTTLHLGNNPNLLTISAHIGSLSLKRLELEACSRLKTPPKEIRAKGFVTTFAYLKRLLTGSVSCKRTKLMLVGLGGAGKTSLVKALLSDNKKTPPSVEQEITDGIDICHWTVPTNEGEITYNVWDFAGQTVYYNTHQFFLSDRAIYFLLWNIRLGHEHAGLQFWLNSISVHAPKAPIFVIGTHLDQMSKLELPKEELQHQYNQICGFHFVSSYTGQGIQELQDRMIEVTLQQQYMGEKIPGVWLSFEESIKSITDKNVIEYKELENKASRSGIFEATEVAHAVQFLHELGSLQHFTNTNLKSHVVISPQWLVDVMACVVSVKDSHIKDGKLNHSDINTLWKDYDVSLHKWLLMLTEEFDLTFPIKDSPTHLVPCLLPETQPEFEWPEIQKEDLNKETKMVYRFDYLPAGLFNRAQVRLNQFCDSSLIWKKGSYLKKNGHICLIHQSKESEVTVKAHGPRPENIVLLVHEVFEILILESFQGITYDFCLPCPDCLRLATKDPHLFPASLIRRATELKSPFLQCLKYFHTVSITDLHAIMPPVSSKDFDLHLVQAIRGMKELKQDLLADVFLSYCEEDLNSKIEVSPNRIIADVKKLGYKCWHSKDKTEFMDEMAKALMDAKIFMAFISNNYVENETCCNLFRFAIQTLKKPIILVAVGDNMEWQRSSLGILTADILYVNMTQSSRYGSKIQELTEALRKKHPIHHDNTEVSKSYPPCFISYTWKNSAKAVAKGSRTTEGALGFGDPRDIKNFLEDNGIGCWLDEERVGQHGLFEDIAEGLLHSSVVVVCISDQYVLSDNCNKEFCFAVNVLQVPVVLAVVGTGDKWRTTELGIMSLKLPLVSFQERSDCAMDKLLKLVQAQLSASSNKSNREKIKSKRKQSVQEQQKLSFQELCELAQRKFVRQISEYIEQLDSGPYPSIIVIDFSSDTKGQDEFKEVKKKQPYLSASDFHDQKFCAQLLCEHEEGWHLSGSALPLDDGFGRTIDQYIPYLARMTLIAKYSKKIVLNCLTTRNGQMYLKWLEENPSVNADFQSSYVSLRQVIYNADPKYQMAKLERCLMPSGKYTWLCETHRRAARVTVVPRESVTNLLHHQTDILGIDYMLQALQEVEPSGLPQKLRRKAETLKNRDGDKEVNQSKRVSSPKALANQAKQEPQLESSRKHEGQQFKRNQEPEPRPTSRACYIM
ncbi:uncharacterized protein LOC106053574 [Biomphalaria glabrata]|uniref:non-specific serine/threonine protein kinase n=1 Tax=Biomphalaria glabrata TaxID=6526 RepID=A0A9W2YM33_BIOGL|nr:uncharacterized protein LOC106053574 [Biomphalaria glabrata]XP_055863725.1 uncharacterized protein LOC106053574 [Biomphalaria glabrata]XP_055863733.1 uncharacterized protein LOC106053574 [Biomphalaria glabrata]